MQPPRGTGTAFHAISAFLTDRGRQEIVGKNFRQFSWKMINEMSWIAKFISEWNRVWGSLIRDSTKIVTPSTKQFWTSENQILGETWPHSIIRIHRTHKSSATKREVAQGKNGNGYKILYKIIIGSSVTFPVTPIPPSIHNPRAQCTRIAQTGTSTFILKLFSGSRMYLSSFTLRCICVAEVFSLTVYICHQPMEVGVLELVVPLHVTRTLPFFTPHIAHKNFRMRRALSAHLSRGACEQTCVSE